MHNYLNYMISQKYFLELLNKNVSRNNKLKKINKKIAKLIIERIKGIKLYSHSYAFKLNFQENQFDVIKLLNFAYNNGLNGINIRYDVGGKKSLRKLNNKSLEVVRLHALKLKLGINIEVSSTSRKIINSVVKIAKILHVKNIRVYIRYSGKISDIIKKGTKDLRYISEIASKNGMHFVIEPHEVLKSKELIKIIKKINNPQLKLLFDYGNMINANENPLDAFKIMSPYITQVHMKGIKKIKLKKGYEQIGVLEGEGDLPQMNLLFNLLLLGKHEPQVKYYSLEQEVGYISPPYRFDKEGNNPIIPYRKSSFTNIDKTKTIKDNLQLEKRNAHKQVQYVRSLLKQIETMSKLIIKE